MSARVVCIQVENLENSPRPIRICLVAPSLDILGGQAVQAVGLFDRLQGVSGLEMRFLPINPRLPGLFRKMQRVKYLRTLVTESSYLLSLLRHLKEFDVIHVFSASYFSFVLAPS